MNERMTVVKMRWVLTLSIMIGAPAGAAAQDSVAAAGGATIVVTLAEAIRRAIDVDRKSVV